MSYNTLASVDPYYDDFDQTKNFHRILFRPGRAVQARELTQSQTILQDQITKFADNIFKQNSPVSGGNVTTNFDCYYVKLQETYNNSAIDVTQWEGKLVRNSTGTVLARVIKVAAPTGSGGLGDPSTLILSYKSGTHFSDNDIIADVNSNLRVRAIALNATGNASVASIAKGVFYILGNFVQISDSTVILGKYTNVPSRRIGLNITETTYDYISDPSLLDPATGASNFQAPGADRYVIALSLDSRPIQLGDDQNFVELVRVEDGKVSKLVDGSVYNVIDDYFAKRDFETNGDYVVNDFKLTPKTSLNDPMANTYTMSVGKGLAYVHGYRLENAVGIDLVSNRARTTASQNNSPVFVDYGSYFYVDTVKGANSSFFDVTTTQAIDLHCVIKSEVDTTNANKYNATVIGTGYIRGLTYDSSNSTDANTYVYKAFVNDIQLAAPTANATGGGASTITLPSTYSTSNTSYVGVNISIKQGTSAGDFRTITSYNGVTKVATVNQPWTVTPDTTSVFTINFDIKDTEAIVSVDGSYNIDAYATINSQSKVNGLTTLINPTIPEMIYNVGSPYVASVKNASYTTQQVFRNVSFTSSGGSVTAQLSYESDYLNVITHLGSANTTYSGTNGADFIKQTYTIIVTNKGTNTAFAVGDNISWVTTGRTIQMGTNSSTATFSATDLTPFTATIIAKVYVENADNDGHILKYKNLITANVNNIVTYTGFGTQVATYTYVDDSTLTSSGQIYIQYNGLVSPGNKQSLYLSDVKRVVKIIDSKSPSEVVTDAMIKNSSYDVTNNYTFDNGQRDNYYDHASITLKPGAPKPAGNIQVFVDYYQHAGGDGYFCLSSYRNSSLKEAYTSIPQYTSNHGTTYKLRDCIDFRPARLNAQSSFIFKYSNEGDTRHGVFLPTDLSVFTSDYSYYLGRKDKLVLTKDRSFQIIEGSPSLTPLLPSEPDGSLVIANLTHDPYTGYIPTEALNGAVSNLSIDKVKHKRYTMQDIAGIENRINNLEYYSALSLLEQKTTSLQISDAYGLNRFKNGIMVDDFSSFATADAINNDYAMTINRRERKMTASQQVKNFPLKSLATVYGAGQLSVAASNSLGYRINLDGQNQFFSLPYTAEPVITQKFASRTVNLNPFSFSTKQGSASLSPNVDNWVDTNYSPALLITDPNLQIFRANSAALNVLSVGDWKTVSGTTTTSSVNVENHGRYRNTYVDQSSWAYGSTNIGYTKTSTYGNQAQDNILGAYDKLGNTYALNNGYITDISILPYIRPQETVVRATGMLVNTPVDAYFDGKNVDKYFRKSNIIELTGVSGTFNENEVIGYYTTGVFHPTARIIAVHPYSGTANVRLYVAADQYSPTYTTNSLIQNGFYTTSGTYQSSTANGTFVSSTHYGGRIRNANSSTQIQLSTLASSTDDFYTGNTIYINAGTGEGQSAVISAYIAANQTAMLATTVTSANSDIYSIGSLSTDEFGSAYGVFNLPANTFHTGQRVMRIDNSNGNTGAETTYAEATYYAEGLQITQQSVDFGASPAGAKGTFTSTAYANNVLISTSYSPWDPVAQTFIVSKDNYPNGLFLDSATFFFQTKPTSDNSPVTLSIVGTQNGYPNGETLDHSVVTLSPANVKANSTPQFLDTNTGTNFKFSAPVYIQPGVLYAFVLKSNSNQYTLWTAAKGDTALVSSVKNLPTDADPSSITKIGTAPYVGSLFTSQNAQTWTADQNQDLMMVVNRCKFTTNVTPTIQYVVPNKLPQRTLVDDVLAYTNNANSVLNTTNTISFDDVLVDAFNITTTDFTPTSTGITYSYNATLTNGNAAGNQGIIPGKFGTATSDDIYLNDGKGERVLVANSNTSLSLYTQLYSADDAVSPIISDAGLSVYAIKWNINNCELSNDLITITNTGASYNASCTSVTVSGTTGSGANAVATIVGGKVTSIHFDSVGSGYITTPTLTITDSTSSGSGATAIVSGETSKTGGNALARYVSKKVVLDAGFDSGDLNVYLSAYRPVNTDINVYYKILSRNDTQSFDDGSWQLMTKTKSSDSSYSQTRDQIIEYTYAPGTEGVDQGFVNYTSKNGQVYNSFSQFAIKVVLTTTDHTYVPFLTDLRAIALPSNVNTTF
jgi:hypothetical protein